MQSIKKVGFYVFFPAGGIGRYSHELMKAMGAIKDVRVEVICSPDYNWKESRQYENWDKLKPVWSPVSLKSKFRFLRGQILNPILAIQHAKQSGFDVLHFSNVNHLTFPLWRPFLKNSSIIKAISVHDVKRQQSMINEAWEEHQLKAVYNFADLLFVHSTYQKKELIDYAKVSEDKIHVVPHGPYPHGKNGSNPERAREQWNLPTDKQIGLFFGQIRDEKNLDSLLNAMSRSGKNFHLLIAGKPWPGHNDAEYYTDIMNQLGLQEKVTFLNRYVEEQEIPSLFSAADWVALPYKNTFTSQSGVLNVAAHYERPILVSDAPVLKETVAENNIGVTCSSDDSNSISEGIHEIIDKVNGGHQFNFDTYKQKHSWDSNARQSIAAYAETKEQML
ncbi:MAG: glycosyltransferase [Candidatus Marinimicrobia bacterium]|nr:glycosyltransferase [Candidatus Neomarinimicrobiota bacterium]